LRHHYVDYGGAGEVIIALPGLVQTARAFDSIAPLLVPHVRLIALDFRGRGETDWGPPERYRFDQYLKDVREFINLMGFEKVGLIGTSLGGFIARMFATAYPARVTRLILNDCAIGGNMAGLLRVGARPATAPNEFASLQEAVEWFHATRPGMDRMDAETQEEYVSHYLKATPGGGLCFDCDPAVIRMADGLVNQLAGLRRTDLESKVVWEQASRLTMPLLLIRGALSDVISPVTIARMQEVLPHAKSVEIPGVSHSPTLYESEAQSAIRDFFGFRTQELAAEAAI
jgi:pimeloyl-ACP methyl ester carboxylesterase